MLELELEDEDGGPAGCAWRAEKGVPVCDRGHRHRGARDDPQQKRNRLELREGCLVELVSCERCIGALSCCARRGEPLPEESFAVEVDPGRELVSNSRRCAAPRIATLRDGSEPPSHF